MAIVGFNFNKISVERKKPATGRININNNVKIVSVDGQNLSLGKVKQEGIKFGFEFICSYEPGVGEIKLEGDVLNLEEASKAKEIIDGWKKTKKLEKNLMAVLLNHILNKCNVKALVLSDDINLPPPLQLPKVQVNTPTKPATKDAKPAPKPAAKKK